MNKEKWEARTKRAMATLEKERQHPMSYEESVLQQMKSKERLLAQLEESARDSGYWIEDSVDELSDLKVNVGGENEVYKSEDGTYAIKLNDFAFLRDDATNFEDFLNRLESFNELFPEIALQVVGY